VNHEGARKEILALQSQEQDDSSPSRDVISNGRKFSPKLRSPGNQTPVKDSPDGKEHSPNSLSKKFGTIKSPKNTPKNDINQEEALALSSCHEFCLAQDEGGKM